VTDGQTERQTDRQTDGQTDGIAIAYMRYSIYAVARKNPEEVVRCARHIQGNEGCYSDNYTAVWL